jgi:multiple sugar transport system permease protein
MLRNKTWREKLNFGQRLTTSQKRESRWGFIFISPWIIGFLLFALIPLVTSLVYTFMDFNLLHPELAGFAGLANYQRLLDDPIAWRSLLLTASYVCIWTPFSVLIPLGIATLLHSRYLFASRIFRLLFYLPTLVPDIAVGFIIFGFFSGRGWFYRLLIAPMGVSMIEGGPLFTSFFGMVLINTSLWGVGNIILILLAARQGVPVDLYEAAKVDGACPICMFFSITLPSISPVLFYSLVISLIGSFQFFSAPYLASGGGIDSDNPWMFFTIYIVRQMTVFHDMSYAATLGWLFVIFVGIMSLIIFGTARRWVFYADE